MRVQELLAAQQSLDPTAMIAAVQASATLSSATVSATSAGSTSSGGTTFAGALANAQTANVASTGGTTTGTTTVTTTGGAPTGGVAPFVPHGGQYGFFPTSSTNYSYGKEPEIAARLDALGTALHLHLVGLSGYRTPQHSVAVGGYANDPHTRGEAMDTPGVEGVPEATLRQYGLTRPFAGASEADHIQLA